MLAEFAGEGGSPWGFRLPAGRLTPPTAAAPRLPPESLSRVWNQNEALPVSCQATSAVTMQSTGVYDIPSTTLSRVTRSRTVGFPEWTPDGRRLAWTDGPRATSCGNRGTGVGRRSV